METYRILIVDGDAQVADSIEQHLTHQNWQVVGIASTYEEALELYHQETPDLVLTDIALAGTMSGIDLAHFLRNQADPVPFIFLTSQFDRLSINQAKETFPAGFLTKPVQQESLIATIEIAMYNHYAPPKEELNITLIDGKKRIALSLDDILYMKAEHVYVQVVVRGRNPIIFRCPLSELVEQLPAEQFAQTHRSYVVNLSQVTHWDKQKIYFQGEPIPVSRSRRKEIQDRLGMD